MLDLYAGSNALKTIKEQGITSSLFTTMLGASGGPKWFTLFGLDKYLFSEFFDVSENKLNLVGSSAGAFRMACFAQKDPVAAISRLAECYSQTVYSDKVNSKEITAKAINLLDYVYGESGTQEIINNPNIIAHFLVNKCNGFVAAENRFLQTLGLVKSILLNRVNRQLIRSQYERFIFRPATSRIEIEDQDSFESHYIDLTPQNIKDALLASGSIPMVMQGIKDIAGAPKGMYRDGGIIDYHFDISFKDNTGLILYPHFNAQPKAGWFDKSLSRKVHSKNYENTLLVVPSAEFIDGLPYQKIPDRKDFETMDAHTRINYWTKVLAETERLAESFHQMVSNQEISRIKPFSP